ncbi:hypothetical protein D3C71_1138170 [compost metagenome]
MCSPFLPCLICVSEVAAQPAIASTAISIKNRFITVLKASPDLVPGSGGVRFRLKRTDILIRNCPWHDSGGGAKHGLIER